MTTETPPADGLPVKMTISPLLPEAGAAGTPLTVVIAVLAFMASVAFAGYFMVSRAAAEWTGDLAGTITVQVKGQTFEEIDRQARAAVTVMNNTPGVGKVKRLSREDTEALLEPWLGTDNLGPDIPVPAIITAEVTPERRRDLSILKQGLEVTSPGATVDDHGQWNDRLIDAARRVQSVAFIIFAMVMAAAACVIIFAARAGLSANRHIVEVMHLVGATDQFIATQVQRRYLSLGLRGGVIGALVAAIMLFSAASFQSDTQGFFLPNLGAAPSMLGWLSLIPLILCAIAAVVARVTVLRTLKAGLA